MLKKLIICGILTICSSIFILPVYADETTVDGVRIANENELYLSEYSGVVADDKAVAPGTTNTVTYTLTNTNSYSVDVDYQVINDSTDEYLPATIIDSDVSQTSPIHLEPSQTAHITLNWDWPIDNDDEKDTELGNNYSNEYVNTTILWNVKSNNIIDTGDYLCIMPYICIAILGAVSFITIKENK